MEYKNGITVVVPVYNAENSLKYCVDSIINQVYKDWYLVLVDDGSTDSSPQICNEYAEKHPNIRVIHKQNGGVSSARNAGIDVVDTEYLVFVDSDDYVSDIYLETLINTKKAYPNIMHIWTRFKEVSSSDYRNSFLYDNKYEFYDISNFIDLIDKVYIQSPCCKLYKTKLIHSNSIRMDEALSLGEDFLFNIDYYDLSPDKKIIVSTVPTYFYVNVSENSLNNKYRSDLLSISSYINNRVFDFIIKNKLDNVQLSKYYNMKFSKYINIFENTMSSHNDSPFIKKIMYNNSILSSNDFVETLSNSTCSINPLIRFGYKKRNYFLVHVFLSAAKIKHKLKVK